MSEPSSRNRTISPSPQPSEYEHSRPYAQYRGDEQTTNPPKEIDGKTRHPDGIEDTDPPREISGPKRGGDESESTSDDPPPPKEISGPKRGG